MMGLHLMLSNASVVIMVFRLILGCLVCRLVGNDLNVRGPMLHCEVEERSWLLVLAFLMVQCGLWTVDIVLVNQNCKKKLPAFT